MTLNPIFGTVCLLIASSFFFFGLVLLEMLKTSLDIAEQDTGAEADRKLQTAKEKEERKTESEN